jgi:hypothetical protein
MSKLGKIVKDTFKAKKESVMGKLGDSPYEDPMEPWSGKYASPVRNEEVEDLTEDSILYRYIRSKGYSPEHMDFAHRSAFARSNAFKSYKVMHANKKKIAAGGINDIKVPTKESVEHLDELNKDTVKSYSNKAAYDVAVQDANKKKIVTGKTSASSPFVAKALETPVRKMANRMKGIVRASERLKKEEVEHLDEISKKTARSYLVKAGKELDKGSKTPQKRDKRIDGYWNAGKRLSGEKPTSEEVEHLDEAGVGKLMNFIKAKGLDPTSMDGNHKKHYSRSSEYRVFKTVHPDPDEARAKHKERTEKKKPKKKLNEISASGEGGDDWNDKFTDEPFVKVKAKKKLKESVDQKDTVTMDIPLLIRVLEYAREDAKTDMDLHKVVENLINMRGEGTMSMAMYDKIVAIKEAIEEADEAKYGEKYQQSVLAVKAKAEKKPVDMSSLAARMQASYSKDKKQPLKELKKQDDNQEITSSLAREEVEELSELSRDTLNRYMWAAKSDRDATDAKMGKTMDKQSKEWSSIRHKKISKMLDKSMKRTSGIIKASDRLAKEEVEDLSELSKGTLKSYIKGRGETIQADKADSNVARNRAADLEYRGKQAQADTNHDEADRLHQRARKGATNVTKAAIKVAKKNEEVVTEGIGGIEDSPLSATNSVKAMEDCSCDTRKQQAMKSARMIKSLYKKKLKESTYDWEKDDKGNKAPTAKIVVKGGKTMTGKDRDTVEIEPILKTRPNSARGMKPGV